MRLARQHSRTHRLSLQKIEAPEKYFKTEQIEKFEHKEKPEKIEHKELENKDFSAEGPPGNPGGPIEQRIAVLEQNVASMQHFITNQQRPDTSRGALASEPGAKKPGSY